MTKKLSPASSSIKHSDGNSPLTTLTRTIHPVGQGAFYSEIFSVRKNKLFTAVYDCGRHNMGDQKTKIERLDTVDLIFISHFHEDHINGIKEIQQYANPLIVIPGISHHAFVIDLIYNYIYTGDKRCNSISLMFDCLPELSSARNNNNKQNQIIIARNSNRGSRFKVVQEGVASIGIPSPSDDSKDSFLWRYDAYFHKYDKEKEKELILKLSESISQLAGHISDDYKEEIWYRNLIDGLSKLNLDTIRGVFASVYKGSPNRYSMLVHSYPVKKQNNMDCLYTGDITITQPVKSTIININPHYIQVPHHGSKNNFAESIYNKRQIAFISVGKKNTYGHPNRETLVELIQICKSVHIITESQKSKYKRRLILK